MLRCLVLLICVTCGCGSLGAADCVNCRRPGFEPPKRVLRTVVKSERRLAGEAGHGQVGEYQMLRHDGVWFCWKDGNVPGVHERRKWRTLSAAQEQLLLEGCRAKGIDPPRLK